MKAQKISGVRRMLTFIVNPNAGGERGYRIWKKLERRLIKKNIAYQVYLTSGRGEARELSAQLSAAQAETDTILVVVGGDGTFNEVLDGARLSEHLVLGFIPIGRESDLARGLRLPHSPEQCLRRILSPREIRQIDYGIAAFGAEGPEHRRFAVSSGCGFDALLAESLRALSLRRCICGPIRRRLVRAEVALRCLLHAQTSKGYLLLDGERRVELNHIFLLSAQLQPTEVGGIRLAGGTAGVDGLLTVCILHTRSRLQQAKALLFSGRFGVSRPAGVRIYRCREARIVLENALPFHADGEALEAQREFAVRCVKQKLKMLC